MKPKAPIGSISQQKQGKMTRLKSHKSLYVIIIIVDILRVSRLVIDSKGSIINTNSPNWVDFATKARNDPKPCKPLEINIIDVVKVGKSVTECNGSIVDGNSSNWTNHATKRRGVEWACGQYNFLWEGPF